MHYIYSGSLHVFDTSAFTVDGKELDTYKKGGDHPEMVMNMKNQAADFICAKYNWDEVVDKTLALYGERSP